MVRQISYGKILYVWINILTSYSLDSQVSYQLKKLYEEKQQKEFTNDNIYYPDIRLFENLYIFIKFLAVLFVQFIKI